MPTPTGTKYHSVLELRNAMRKREPNFGRCPECWEYGRWPPLLAVTRRFGVWAGRRPGLELAWRSWCRCGQAGQRRRAAGSWRSLLLARPVPNLDMEAIAAQAKWLDGMRAGSESNFSCDATLSISASFRDPSYDHRGWECGETRVV